MSWLFFFWEICSISLNRLKIKVTTLMLYIQTTFVIKHMAWQCWKWQGEVNALALVCEDLNLRVVFSDIYDIVQYLFEKILNWNWGAKNCRWRTDIPLKWTHCIFAIFSLVQKKKCTHTVNEILAYEGRERTTSSLSLLIQLSLFFLTVWGKWAVIVEEWQFSDKLYASPIRYNRLYHSTIIYIECIDSLYAFGENTLLYYLALARMAKQRNGSQLLNDLSY